MATPATPTDETAPEPEGFRLGWEHALLALRVLGIVVKWALVAAFAVVFAAAGALVLGWVWAALSETACDLPDACKLDPLFDIEYATGPATAAFWIGFPIAALFIGLSAWRAGRRPSDR